MRGGEGGGGKGRGGLRGRGGEGRAGLERGGSEPCRAVLYCAALWQHCVLRRANGLHHVCNCMQLGIKPPLADALCQLRIQAAYEMQMAFAMSCD